MITWKRDKRRGDHVGFVAGRPVARIVRLSASAWRWSYRGPHQSIASVDESRLLKHAKQAVEGLNESRRQHCKADDPASAARAKTTARAHAAGEGPRGDQVRDEKCTVRTERVEGPHPSVGAEPGFDAKRVEGPPLWGQPLEVESTPQTVCDFREGAKPSPAAPRGMVSGENPEQASDQPIETPRGAAPFSQLSLLGGSDA